MTTADRLRADIDRGQAGDKVPFSDPAAAPLGTDDEAAGTPPTAERVALARATEGGAGREPPPGDTGEERRPYNDEAQDSLPGQMPGAPAAPRHGRGGNRRAAYVLAGAVVVMGALLAIWAAIMA
ncbi:hypothetical protein AncyloWKF20_01085 [Ancylobacter sp. WKF20]|uniref:hypothetical protein n=1 Tax=Ancylobacter sp. WKF20 TaxID=3039801 RepID=UPI0024341EAA|nr:hypothetical protein [Ancylobacter sp. WKF20]WGD30467.1 hypothetical protein AncyloWKF20_01085 [Ancylobacter sp. WKF20]